MRSICVFCGSSPGQRPEYQAAARHLGAELARRGVRVIFGGGRVGMMGAVADGALAAGGEVIGVIPQALVQRELAHPNVTRMHVVASMHDRKALMEKLADGFAALPGGFGTLEELCEMLTWAQLGLHAKPIGLLNTLGYFDPLLNQFDHAIAEEFFPAIQRQLFVAAARPEEFLNLLLTHRMPPMPRWIDREET